MQTGRHSRRFRLESRLNAHFLNSGMPRNVYDPSQFCAKVHCYCIVSSFPTNKSREKKMNAAKLSHMFASCAGFLSIRIVFVMPQHLSLKFLLHLA